MVEFLYKNPRLEVNERDTYNMTPLHLCLLSSANTNTTIGRFNSSTSFSFSSWFSSNSNNNNNNNNINSNYSSLYYRTLSLPDWVSTSYKEEREYVLISNSTYILLLLFVQ